MSNMQATEEISQSGEVKDIPINLNIEGETNTKIQVYEKNGLLECPLNWVQSLKIENVIFHQSVRKNILEYCEVHKKKALQYALRHCTIEYVVKTLLKSLFLANDGDFDISFETLKTLKSDIVQEVSSIKTDEFRDGLLYLVAAQQRKVTIMYGEDENSDVVNEIQCLPFNELSDISKATVMAAKVFICKVAKFWRGEMIFIDRVLDLDTTTADFRLLHFIILRSRRYDDDYSRFRDLPSNRELDALRKACDLDPDNAEMHISTCKTLFEYLRPRTSMESKKIQIGGIVFSDPSQIVVQLNETLRMLVAQYPMSVWILNVAAQMFTSKRLPDAFRDPDFAFKCINSALEIWPTSSDLLHRYGVMHLTEKLDFETAETYFTRAVTEDNRNFIAVVDYFWICGRCPNEGTLEILDFLLSSDDVQSWAAHVLTELLFIKGCILFALNKDLDTGILAWLSSSEKSGRWFRNRVFAMNGTFRRFGWVIENDENKYSRDKFVAMIIGCLETSVDKEPARNLLTLFDSFDGPPPSSKMGLAPRNSKPQRNHGKSLC